MPNMKYMEEKISIPPYLIYMSMDMLTSNMIRQSGILKPNIPHPIQRIIPNRANGLFILKYLIVLPSISICSSLEDIYEACLLTWYIQNSYLMNRLNACGQLIQKNTISI